MPTQSLSVLPLGLLPLVAAVLLSSGIFSTGGGQARALAIDKPDSLALHNATAAATTYRERAALKLTRAADASAAVADVYAIVKDSAFSDGTIEVDVASTLSAEAKGTEARGFIGVGFRLAADRSRYEHFYIRPTNGRANDQVRRNHSTQYTSHPDFPWHRLRKEFPEKYESYVDLELGVWTGMKVVVKGTTAQLFVNGASQPCLIVNDLKLGVTEGAIALMIGPGTEGYFANLRVAAAR